jgi:cytochrome b561
MTTLDAGTVRWSGRRKALHWLVVFLILFEVPAGFLMSYTYGPGMKDRQVGALHDFASQIHHTVGFALLLAGLVWLVLRLRTPRPPLPADTSALQRRLTFAAHAGLGLLLVLIPWSGWTALSALADSPQFGPTHIWLFGADRVMPRIWTALPFNDPMGYRLFGRMHVYLLYAGGAILLLHALAVLWHHNVKRDDIFVRMWP